jgi:polysaccharide export outer membrane protein
MRNRSRGSAAAGVALVALLAWPVAGGAQTEVEAEAVPVEEAAPESAPAAVAAPEAVEPGAGGSWPADGAAPAPAAAPPDYTIGAADMVRITVWRNPELSAEVPVRPDGRISVPLVGDVDASGMTTAELRDRIAGSLSEYITAPDVTVVVTQINSKIVYLVGEVARPTALPLNRQMRILDAIAMAGGFTPFADKNDIRVLRPLPDGTIEEHEFNYGKVVKGKQPESNLVLQAGDTIVVPD